MHALLLPRILFGPAQPDFLSTDQLSCTPLGLFFSPGFDRQAPCRVSLPLQRRAYNRQIVLTPEYCSLSSSEAFIKFYLRNKTAVEEACIQNVAQNNLVWFYDPTKDQIEWIGLLELVQNLVTEQFDELVDPLKIICGCSLVPFDAVATTPANSFYLTNPIEICTFESQGPPKPPVPKIEYSNVKFFQEKAKGAKKKSALKLRQVRKKPRAKKQKAKSKRSIRGRRGRYSSSEHTRPFHSSNNNFGLYLTRAEKSWRSKSFRISGRANASPKPSLRKRKSKSHQRADARRVCRAQTTLGSTSWGKSGSTRAGARESHG